MLIKERIKTVCVHFFEWLDDNTFYNMTGYMFVPKPQGKLDDNEYSIDEIFDYWIENIYLNP